MISVLHVISQTFTITWNQPITRITPCRCNRELGWASVFCLLPLDWTHVLTQLWTSNPAEREPRYNDWSLGTGREDSEMLVLP